MATFTPIKRRKIPGLIPVGFNLYIKIVDGKFGLHDYDLQADMLSNVYDLIDPCPGSTYLMVYQNNLVGVYDILLRYWLVPVKYSQIHLTNNLMEFAVFSDTKRGLHDGVTGRVTWS